MSQQEKVELPEDINQRTKDIALPNKKKPKEKPKSKKRENNVNPVSEQSERKCAWTKKKIILLSIAAAVVVIGIIVVCIFALRKPPEDEKKEVEQKQKEPEVVIKNEFSILTRPGDLKHVEVTQKSKEENILNGKEIINNIVRKTNYDIYFISESEPENKEKIFYSKMYQGVVTIRSECTEEGEDCEPKELVDLIQAKNNLRNLRNLQNSEAFKDQPIALCLFNITDNNVITTFTCPRNLSYVKRNEIILDLYFFRPPAAERPDKEGDGITLDITVDNSTQNTLIHETNKGYCNIYKNWASNCTTDMNTTLDKDLNLINYEEKAYTFISYDNYNSFTKNKVTTLADKSENIKPEDIKNYEKSFHNLLPLLKPYMEEEVQFTEKDYEDLYNIITDKKKSKELQSYTPKKIKNTFRNLANEKKQQIKQADIFNDRITPIQVTLFTKINSGINSEKTGVYSGIIFDETEFDFSSIELDSIVSEILEKLTKRAKAGNSLAAELYDKIYYKFESFLNELVIKINSIEQYLKYYDLIDVFEPTLTKYSYKSLPSDIVRISKELEQSLSNIISNIRTGDIKYNAEILENDIYSYTKRIQELIRSMLNNLATLSNILVTKNNTFTVITNYYLNNTSSSYFNIIQKMKMILETYFIHEYNTIYPKMEEIMEELEQNNNDTLKEELNSLRNLYTNLKEKIYTIVDISESDYQLVLSNLEKSLQHPFDIISLIKEYLTEIMHIQSNGYLISDADIKAFNQSFASIIADAEKVVKILDNANIIDKVFDEIMIKFRESYITTINFMEQIKKGNFTLEEDVLNKTLFATSEKERIENNLKALCEDMLDKIKEENDVFINMIKQYFDKFLEDNLDDLNNIIIDLSVIFSEEALQSLSNTFEISLNTSLNTFTKITKNNVRLTEEYINKYYDTIKNDTALKELLKTYYLDYTEIYRPYYDPSRTHQFPTFDIIYGKMRTSAYLSKYNNFIANLNYTEEYLINQLSMDITDEYREIFTKIKEELASIINNKLNEKFPDFYEVNFFDNHVKIIDKLTTRLDKYFSDKIFETKYKTIIDENVNYNLELIRNTRNGAQNKNEYIKTFPILSDNTNDMCITFRRKVCYGCTNCVSYTFFYDRYCFILAPYDLNYLELKRNTYESVSIFGEFNETFNNLNDLIKVKVDNYNYKVGNLNLNISYIKNETLKRHITDNYLDPLTNYIDSLLKEKFENVLLNSTYNYYESGLSGKLELMFKDIFEKWRKSYDTLSRDILAHSLDIKYSHFEFTEMAENYRTIIQVDQTENYYNSIILFERSELNYMVSYYYNYLMRLISKSYNYLMQNIEMYENDYNEILKERKAELTKSFNNIEIKIFLSEKQTIDNQISILNVNETDFFNVKYILNKNVNETDNALQEAIDDIWRFEMFLDPGDRYSLVMRYYLENKEFGKLIEDYYNMFDIYLDLSKFKEVMLENWVFEGDDFVNMINKALYSTNLEIKKELFVKLEEYSETIEDEIKKFLNNDIEVIISNLFSGAIKEVTSLQKTSITSYIKSLIEGINNTIKTEADKISAKTYLLNADSIKENLKTIETNIKNSINASIIEVLNNFKTNIYQNLYSSCFENKLADYLTQARNIMSLDEYKNYALLNTSFNIGETIYNLTNEVINNYKNVIKKKIEMKHNEYFNKIKSEIDLAAIYNLIETEIENIYQTKFADLLTQNNNCTGCSKFTFAQATFDSVNNDLNTMSSSIKNVMDSLQGDKYQAIFQCTLDFANSGNNVIKPICNSMKEFLSFEKEEQVSRINENIQSLIKNNLEDFLNNVVPNFGNEFFERIIDYNINFKLSNLYENLHYGIGQTLLYYEALEVITVESDLPSDLKNRLYALNDLDITVQDNVYEIKALAETKLNELITNLKYAAKDNYNRFINEDHVIKNSLSSNVFEKIDFTLQEIMPDIEREYQKSLEKYLKEKFMNDFSDSLDEKTNYMLKIFYEEKKKLMDRLDKLFSNKGDEDLNAVNNNINRTLDSIQVYKNFYRNFSLTQSAKDFFLNYPENTLLPIFKKFNKDLYDSMRIKIVEEINNKSKAIENLDISPFKNILNEIYNKLLYGYINFIHSEIYKVCETDYIYRENYLKKIQEYDADSRRRLTIGDVIDEDEYINESKQIYESKYVQDSMDQLVIKARNTRSYVETLNVFVYYSDIIQDYQNRLNIEYKNLRAKIIDNKYTPETEKFLLDKLYNLAEILRGYYNEIINSFYALRTDILESITNLQNALDSCYYYMEIVINDEYYTIYRDFKKVDEKKTNYLEEYKTLRYKHQAENMMNTGTAHVYKLNEYAEFKSDLLLYYIGGFYVPHFKAKITSKTHPENVLVDVMTGYGFCYEQGHRFNISLNDVNYTMDVEYDTKTGYINLQTYTDIKEYKYTLQNSKVKGEATTEQISMDNYVRTFQCKNLKRTVENRQEITVSGKKRNEYQYIFQ